MDTSKHCQSFRIGQQLCADGFPVSSICRGDTCRSCGEYSTKKPACQNEDLGAPWIDENGWPKFTTINS